MQVSQEMRTVQICLSILCESKVQLFNQTGDKLLGAMLMVPHPIFVFSSKGGYVVSLIDSPEQGS